jgi:hypothetical protein
LDLAASNAKFWTGHGWDGSESILQASREFCAQLPRTRRNELFSASTATTVVVILQGLQRVYELNMGILGGRGYSLTVALDYIFVPLAVLGLLRLSAAPWLTDHYAYASIQNREPAITTILEEDDSTFVASPGRRPLVRTAHFDHPSGEHSQRYVPLVAFLPWPCALLLSSASSCSGLFVLPYLAQGTKTEIHSNKSHGLPFLLCPSYHHPRNIFLLLSIRQLNHNYHPVHRFDVV